MMSSVQSIALLNLKNTFNLYRLALNLKFGLLDYYNDSINNSRIIPFHILLEQSQCFTTLIRKSDSAGSSITDLTEFNKKYIENFIEIATYTKQSIKEYNFELFLCGVMLFLGSNRNSVNSEIVIYEDKSVFMEMMDAIIKIYIEAKNPWFIIDAKIYIAEILKQFNDDDGKKDESTNFVIDALVNCIEQGDTIRFEKKFDYIQGIYTENNIPDIVTYLNEVYFCWKQNNYSEYEILLEKWIFIKTQYVIADNLLIEKLDLDKRINMVLKSLETVF